MNGYDQQLKELLAQCARKRKLEASAAELRRQRDTYAARAEELKEAMREEQADVDRLEGRSLAAFFYNVVGKMDEKLTVYFQTNLFLMRRDLEQLCGLTQITANRQLKRLILISAIFAKNCERAVGRYIGIIMSSETLEQEF